LALRSARTRTRTTREGGPRGVSRRVASLGQGHSRDGTSLMGSRRTPPQAHVKSEKLRTRPRAAFPLDRIDRGRVACRRFRPREQPPKSGGSGDTQRPLLPRLSRAHMTITAISQKLINQACDPPISASSDCLRGVNQPTALRGQSDTRPPRCRASQHSPRQDSQLVDRQAADTDTHLRVAS